MCDARSLACRAMLCDAQSNVPTAVTAAAAAPLAAAAAAGCCSAGLLRSSHLGKMVQQDLSIACDHGGRCGVALPLAHGGKELVPCLCGGDEDCSLQVLGVEDVLEHRVQRQVRVLACNEVQGGLALLLPTTLVVILLLCIGCCNESTCTQRIGAVTSERQNRRPTQRGRAVRWGAFMLWCVICARSAPQEHGQEQHGARVTSCCYCQRPALACQGSSMRMPSTKQCCLQISCTLRCCCGAWRLKCLQQRERKCHK